MVIRLACVCACLLGVLSACTTDSDKETPREPGGSVSHIVASDTGAAVTLTAAEAHVDSLVLRYTPGEVYRYRTQQTTTGGTDSARIFSFSEHYYTKRIKSKRADGNFEIGITFDSLRTEFNAKNTITGQELRREGFNSRDSAQLKDPRNMGFAAVLGIEVSMIITPQGKVQEIIGASTIVNRMIPPGENPPPDRREAMKRQVETNMFGAFSEQEYLRFPGETLDSNQTWKTSTATPLGDLFTIESTNTYHVASVKKVKNMRIAEVTASVDGSIKARPIPAQYQNLNVSVKVKKSVISGKGRTVIDLNKGYTISKTNDVHMEVDALVTNQGEKRVNRGQQETNVRYNVELLR